MKISTIAAASLLTFAAGAAFAIEPPAPPAPPAGLRPLAAPLPPSALTARTRAEAEALAKARFAAVDTNHDGYITRAESDAARERLVASAQGDAKAGLGRYFEIMDADHDGSISRAEFDAFHAGSGRDIAGADGMRTRVMVMQRGAPDDAAHAGAMPPHAALGAGPEARGRMRPEAIDGAMIDGLFDSMDANGDNRVSLAEATKAAQDHFDALDANHDGTLSPAERRGGARVMVMKRMGMSPRAN